MTNEQKQALVDNRFEQASQDAEEAFWGAIANAYPEIETGDLGPDVVMPLIENMKIAMAAWLVGNRPEGRMPNEFVPIAYNSGEIYE
jgi:hypothetical protein